MKRSIIVRQKKRGPGRPKTGQTPIIGVRLSKDTRKTVEAWAGRQSDNPKLSEAIRRLIDLGLGTQPAK